LCKSAKQKNVHKIFSCKCEFLFYCYHKIKVAEMKLLVTGMGFTKSDEIKNEDNTEGSE